MVLAHRGNYVFSPLNKFLKFTEIPSETGFMRRSVHMKSYFLSLAAKCDMSRITVLLKQGSASLLPAGLMWPLLIIWGLINARAKNLFEGEGGTEENTDVNTTLRARTNNHTEK